MQKILVIEDDEKLARILKIQLEHEGFQVDNVFNGMDAYNLVQENKSGWHIIILDLGVPGMSGELLCKNIKKISSIPVIVLSAKSSVEDKITLLSTGASDYVTKPFNMMELSARIRVNILEESKTEILFYSDLELDYSKYTVLRGKNTIQLSKTEFELLSYLMKNREIVLTRDRIIESVWGYEASDNVLDVTMKNLRNKIDKGYEKKLIHTVRGVGYVLQDKKDIT